MKIARWTLVAIFLVLGIYTFLWALTIAMLSVPWSGVPLAFAQVRAETLLFISFQMFVNAVIFFFLLRSRSQKT